MNCNNICNGACRGPLKPVKVFAPNYSYFWGSFTYCEGAIEKETSKGNIVDTPDNYDPCPERQLAISVSAQN